MSTIIVGALLVFISACIIRSMVHNRKKSSCAQGCGNCKGCH